jgi:hypothetical protein
MIKALWLILKPTSAWEWIVRAQRGVLFISLGYLLPMLVLSSMGEGYGLSHWGKLQGPISHPKIFAVGEAVVFEALQLLLSLLVVFVGANLVKAVGETFHGRHTYLQAFTVVAYGLSPVFLLRLLDMAPAISPWIGWAAGILLCFTVLYHGVPRVMDPDPPQAFGLYVTTSFLLLLISGLARFLTASYLQGKFTKLEPILSGLGAKLPF